MASETSGGTSGAVPPPPPHFGAGPPRRLTRRPSEGHIGGVCAGLAHYFNVDPVIVRIAAAVVILSGPGILAYILAWIFVPEASKAELAESYAPRSTPPFRADRSSQVFGVIIVSLSVIFLWGGWWSPVRRWGFPFALMALGLWLIFRKVRDDEPGDADVDPASPYAVPTTATAVTDPASEAAGESQPDEVTAPAMGQTASEDDDTELAQPATDDPTAEQQTVPPWHAATAEHLAGQGAGLNPPQHPDHHRRPRRVLTEEERAARRRRRMVFPTVMGALLVWAGIAALSGVGLQASLAVALCVVGLGFVLGAVMGGGKLLIFPAILLGGALIVTTVLDLPLDGPVGKRHHEPASVADLEGPFEVSIGQQIIDLTNLDMGDEDEVTLTASIGVGHLVVHVPDDTDLSVHANIEMGEVKVLGASQSGVGVEWSRGVDLGASERTINLDLEAGIGQIEVILGDGTPETLR